MSLSQGYELDGFDEPSQINKAVRPSESSCSSAGDAKQSSYIDTLMPRRSYGMEAVNGKVAELEVQSGPSPLYSGKERKGSTSSMIRLDGHESREKI